MFSGVPPLAETLAMPLLANSEKTMVSSSPQLAPKNPPMLLTVTGVPPWSETFFNAPAA